MIKYNLINGLITQAKKIKEVYQEIGLRGINNELKNQLYTLVKEEEMIYSFIPLEEYPQYLDYFLEFLEQDLYDYVPFITLMRNYKPEMRIVWKFLYLQSKTSVFGDTNKVAEDFRWQYLYENERFTNLLLFYAIFLKKYEKYKLNFNASFMSVLYHSPYAEAIYFKNNIYYDKEWLFKFSGFSNVYSEMDKDFIAEIQLFCSDLFAVTMIEEDEVVEEKIIEQEEILNLADSLGTVVLVQEEDFQEENEGIEEEFSFLQEETQEYYLLEEPFTKIGIIMYLTTLCYSISNQKLAIDLLNSYKSLRLDKNQKEIIEEVSLLINHEDVLKKELLKNNNLTK